MNNFPLSVALACSLTALLCACESEQASGPNTAPMTTSSAPDTTLDAANSPLPGPGEYLIDLSAGRGVIRANQVDERKILAGVAGEAGYRVMVGDVEWQTVTVDIEADTLHDALVELLGERPYQIIYAPDSESREEVLSRVEVGEPPFTELALTDRVAETNATDTSLTKAEQQQSYLQQLSDPDEEKRVEAAKKIKAQGEALDMLTDMLRNDPSPEVRIATTWSLEISEDPAALSALIGCLNDPDNTVVIECMDSLEFAGDETTVVYLEPFLDHPDKKVRAGAVEAIRFLE
jgi:hypothetical protein